MMNDSIFFLEKLLEDLKSKTFNSQSEEGIIILNIIKKIERILTLNYVQLIFNDDDTRFFEIKTR